MSNIPHNLHRIWVAGSGPMPAEYEEYGKTWRDLNPGWDYYEWHSFPYWGTNPKQFADAETFSEQSDVLRYEVINHFGGVYIDTDFEAFVPISDLIDTSPHDFIACPEYTTNNYVHYAAGFFAASPFHPLLEQIIRDMPASIEANDTPATRAGPTYLQSILHKHEGEFAVVPAELFYPYHGGEVWDHSQHPNAIAAHHWAASWRKPNRSLYGT
jgi:mannosyltransferase OCH1-like enzyme